MWGPITCACKRRPQQSSSSSSRVSPPSPEPITVIVIGVVVAVSLHSDQQRLRPQRRKCIPSTVVGISGQQQSWCACVPHPANTAGLGCNVPAVSLSCYNDDVEASRWRTMSLLCGFEDHPCTFTTGCCFAPDPPTKCPHAGRLSSSGNGHYEAVRADARRDIAAAVACLSCTVRAVAATLRGGLT